MLSVASPQKLLTAVSASLGLAATAAAGSSVSCPANLPQSCHNTSAVADTCCFAAPGGLLLQTQFWDTPPDVTGPVDSWTVHGLWPDNCDGTHEANCDPSRAYTNITQILQSYGANDLLEYMNTYWTDYHGDNEQFWEHEWAKHGTCISTFDTDCYNSYTPQEEVVDFFNATTRLFSTLDSYHILTSAGITPSSTANYTSQSVLDALQSATGYTPYISCESGALNQIWYYFYLTGSVQSGTFAGTDAPGNPNGCPTSLQWLPKSQTGSPSPSSSSTTTTSTASAPSSTSTNAFVGKGYANVVTSGSQQGCLISAGTWYSSGTCATYTGTSSSSGDGDSVTLSTSKGACAIGADGTLACASSVTAATAFGVRDGMLEYGGSTTFYASAVPSGSQQVKVETGVDSVSLQIVWQAR